MKTIKKETILRLAVELGFTGKECWAPMYDGQMWIASCEITPALAESILSTRNKKNRTVKKNSLEKYARDMESDRWCITHEAIAFNVEGWFLDGQHRLLAICKTKKSQTLLVVIGLDDEAVKSIDTVTPRTVKDAANYFGVETTTTMLASIKNANNGLMHITNSVSNAEQLDLLDEYEDSVLFIQKNCGKKQIGVTSAVLGAIVRCYNIYCKGNNQRISRLKRFCQILSDGQYNNVMSDKAAFTLRERLAKGGLNIKQRYALTEKCLVQFFAKQDSKFCRPVTREQFTISVGD